MTKTISDTKRCAGCKYWQRFSYNSTARFCDHKGMTGKRRQYREEDGFCLSFEPKGEVNRKWCGIVLRGSHAKRRKL